MTVQTGKIINNSLTASQVVMTDANKKLISVASNAVGGMTLVSTATPSAVSSFTISGLNPGIRYVLYVNTTQNTSTGNQYTQFNSDTGANYYTQLIFSNGSTNTAQVQNTTYHYLIGSATATSNVDIILNFTSPQVSDNYVQGEATSSLNYGATSLYTLYNAIYYKGSAPLSSVTFGTTAGTITGKASLYSLN